MWGGEGGAAWKSSALRGVKPHQLVGSQTSGRVSSATTRAFRSRGFPTLAAFAAVAEVAASDFPRQINSTSFVNKQVVIRSSVDPYDFLTGSEVKLPRGAASPREPLGGSREPGAAAASSPALERISPLSALGKKPPKNKTFSFICASTVDILLY